MNAGTLQIGARHDGTRTVVDRLRYDGLARCSRPFARDGAALVVLAQLGPGVIRGDAVATSGRVDPGAHLIITQQTATRILGGAQTARSRADWSVAQGATLELIGEPIVAADDANYEATTTIDLASEARVLVAEIAHVPGNAKVRLRTVVTRAGREIVYDAVDAQAAAPQAVGTLVFAGLTEEAATGALVALDAAADTIDGVRVGVGLLSDGVFARVTGEGSWIVRAALETLGRYLLDVRGTVRRG
jgi:urease accessory protein UreH